MRLRPSGRSRVVSVGVAVAVFGALLIAAPTVSLADPPPNPTNGQISAAQARKDALANRVGQLSGQIAAMESQLQVLQAKQELAEQKYAYAISQLEAAKAAVLASRARVAAAQRQADAANVDLVRYVQATYMSSSTGDTTETLLTAADPSALLETGAVQRYQTAHQVDALGAMQRAMIEKSNAEAAARLAQQRQQQLTDAARQAQADARAAVVAARAQQAQLQTTLAASRQALSDAQSTLADLNNQRAQYVAWQAEQRRLAAERARQAELARERAARERRQHQSNGDGGSSGGGWSGGGSTPIVASGGSWSSGRAQSAVSRAMSTLGTPYAWAGGNSGGPTWGVCDPGNGAPNDCHVYGYDCSGLVMYAWGPYISLPHYAASQYVDAGSYHPSSGDLLPGDLIFWSFDGTIGGIHHVAMYIGGGQIIEAPYSGGYVQTASLYEYGSYFGATRPLT